MTSAAVQVQIAEASRPMKPAWLGEGVAFAQVLTHEGMLKTIQDQVLFARVRVGHYNLVDFVVMLIGYILSGEPTLLAFYERLVPWASPFMAFLAETACPIAQPCPGSWLLSISQQWKPWKET